MGTIDIFSSMRPERGKYIAHGKYAFEIVDGAPVMRCRWRGGLLSSEEVFHFQTQAEKFHFLDTKSTAEKAIWDAQDRTRGLLPRLLSIAWRAATTKSKGMQAFAISYVNAEGHGGVFSP